MSEAELNLRISSAIISFTANFLMSWSMGKIYDYI